MGNRTLLWLVSTRPDGIGRFRAGPGQPVRLWRERPEDEDAVRGVIARRRRDQLGVMIQGDAPESLHEGGLRLDKDDDQATFDRGDRALGLFRDAPRVSGRGRLREVLLGEREPEYGPTPSWEPLDPDLNPPQREASAWRWPRATWRSCTAPPAPARRGRWWEVIRQIVAGGGRVLATAASNTAVDNLAERLVEAEVDAVRLGHPARVSSGMEHRTLDALLEASDGYDLARDWIAQGSQLRRQTQKKWAKRRIEWSERKQALSEANRLFRDARKQLEGLKGAILEGAEVICATAAGADSLLLGEQTFDAVVLDEATQAPDPIALVAALRADRLIMAGDPLPAPPTVIDRRAEHEGLGVTIFERLTARWGDVVVRMLEVQHRMHATLMAFPSESMYEGRLVAAPAVAERRLADLDVTDDPLRPGPLLFVDTAGKGWDEQRTEEDPSTFNPEQAERTAAEVRRLLGRGLRPDQVAVITPYDAQARRLRDLLADARREGLEVGTVDGFQGREQEAVIVDLVRSNHDGQLGFLRDVRRMNVALTRAKRFLLVLGDSATLGEHPFYAGFVQAAEAAGGYLERLERRRRAVRNGRRLVAAARQQVEHAAATRRSRPGRSAPPPATDPKQAEPLQALRGEQPLQAIVLARLDVDGAREHGVVGGERGHPTGLGHLAGGAVDPTRDREHARSPTLEQAQPQPPRAVACEQVAGHRHVGRGGRPAEQPAHAVDEPRGGGLHARQRGRVGVDPGLDLPGRGQVHALEPLAQARQPRVGRQQVERALDLRPRQRRLARRRVRRGHLDAVPRHRAERLGRRALRHLDPRGSRRPREEPRPAPEVATPAEARRDAHVPGAPRLGDPPGVGEADPHPAQQRDGGGLALDQVELHAATHAEARARTQQRAGAPRRRSGSAPRRPGRGDASGAAPRPPPTSRAGRRSPGRWSSRGRAAPPRRPALPRDPSARPASGRPTG